MHTYLPTVEGGLHNVTRRAKMKLFLSSIHAHESFQYRIDFCSVINIRRRRQATITGKKEKNDCIIKPGHLCSMTTISMIMFIEPSIFKAYPLASFDRYASPYQSSSFHPNLEDQQQGNEETLFTSSHTYQRRELVVRLIICIQHLFVLRPEVTFDINNCIFRCFEAHRQNSSSTTSCSTSTKSQTTSTTWTTATIVPY